MRQIFLCAACLFAALWTVELRADFVDLGQLPNDYESQGVAINDSSQVAGDSSGESPQSTGEFGFLYSNGTMDDLGTLGAEYTVAAAINASGQVAGSSETSAGGTDAFLYTNGQIHDLGSLGGNATTVGMNNAGDVFGYSNLSFNPNTATDAFLYINGSMHDLGTLGGMFSYGQAINSVGDVVGYAATSTQETHAFLYTADAGMQDLGTLGYGTSYAKGINDSGEVVGYSNFEAGSPFTHAFLYTIGGSMQDLGTLGGLSSEGLFINNAGQIAGFGDTADGQGHAFLYTDDQMIDIGVLDGQTSSQPIALNDVGQILGMSGPDAFLYSYSNGTMVDLTSLLPPGWSEFFPTGLNDFGVVTGTATDPEGDTQAILLSVPVPEPIVAASLLCVGAPILLGRRKRQLHAS